MATATATTTRRPAEVFHPGEFLREELEERGWTQSDLAEILGRPLRLVNEIIMGKRGISPETAAGLAAALGTSPELWMNLDSAYQLWTMRDTNQDSVARRARLYQIGPIKDMVRRGWIEPSDNVAVLEKRVLDFFEMKSLDEEPRFAVAARKATIETSPTQKAWLFRAKQIARAVHAAPYQPAKLDEALAELRRFLLAPQETRHVPRVLAKAGVRMVIVEPLSGSKIDGACFWLDDAPVVAMSLRFDRIDNFWFVLEHELGHVKHRHKGSVDTDLMAAAGGDGDGRPPEEQVADQFATQQLVPPDKLEGFIDRVRPLYSATKIEGFARLNGVHPGIVVGQLQHRGEVQYSSFRNLLAPVREVVKSSALTDGWGATIPTASVSSAVGAPEETP